MTSRGVSFIKCAYYLSPKPHRLSLVHISCLQISLQAMMRTLVANPLRMEKFTHPPLQAVRLNHSKTLTRAVPATHALLRMDKHSRRALSLHTSACRQNALRSRPRHKNVSVTYVRPYVRLAEEDKDIAEDLDSLEQHIFVCHQYQASGALLILTVQDALQSCTISAVCGVPPTCQHSFITSTTDATQRGTHGPH